jgi:hypothetical protein
MKRASWICLALMLLPVASVIGQPQIEVAFPNLSFVRPVDLQDPGDGTNRLFVVEQRGIIWVFENTPDVAQKKLFLDIRDRVNDVGNEEGLLGLAFHPDYADSGHFYVDYTALDPRRTVVARYQVTAANPDSADHNSEFVVLEVNQPRENHNGGRVVFGPDGFLYIGMGDGGGSGDPNGNGQNLTTLLGALLRIDVDTTTVSANYGIPPDNPFAGNVQGYREEIFAYGLRNPWRFSFDLDTGRLWLADVGQNLYEEIDVIEVGKNYGWNIMEGLHCYQPPSGCDMTGLELPIWEYDHGLGNSVTGGYVYRGSRRPDLVGKYIYADYVSGLIWALEYDGVNPPSNSLLLDTSVNIASFGTDHNDKLYICAFDGNIYQFEGTLSAVALQGYHSYWVDGHVEIAWNLRDVGSNVAFEVYRAEGTNGRFGRLGETGVVNRDGEFVFEDHVVEPGKTYLYRVDVIENGEVSVLFATTVTTPATIFTLDQNRPNPFNTNTNIRFSLANNSRVRLSVYDVAGRVVATLIDREMAAGTYVAGWDGRNENGTAMASGLYFFQLRSGKFTLTRKAVLLR